MKYTLGSLATGFSAAVLAALFLVVVGHSTLRAASLPDDPLFSDQSNLSSAGMDAVGAWQYTTGLHATVALIDCGVEFTHPDLIHSWWLNPGELPVAADIDGDGEVRWTELAVAATLHPEWQLVDHQGEGLDLGDLFASGLMDGVDGDGNGFVDDISGWDFDDDDPIADDISECGHGNGRAGILAAGWNSIGSAGILREGRIIPLRTSDTILHSVDTVAQAIAYAGSMGASSVNMSLGALGKSPLLQWAVAYANERGTVLAAASGNEYVPDVEMPAGLKGVLAAGSVSPEPFAGLPWSVKIGSTSFGPHLFLAAPSNVWTTAFPTSNGWWKEGGTSSATPHLAATAALLHAYATLLTGTGKLQKTLSSQEIRQLMRTTAHDLSGSKYNAAVGWDRFTGWGRVQAGAALAALDAGTIPPEAELHSPEQFAYLDPDVTPTIDILGTVAAPRAASFGYRVEIGVGIEVTAWDTVAEKHGLAEPVDGVLAGMVDLTRVQTTSTDPILERLQPSSNTVTVRLTAWAEKDGKQVAAIPEAVDRQTFYLRREPTLRKGFPVRFTGSLEGSPLLVDLNRDGLPEIVLCDSGGSVFAVDASGAILWSAATGSLIQRDLRFAKWLSAHSAEVGGGPLLSGASASDLDGDGSLEVIAANWAGRVYAWHSDGQLVEGFPTVAAIHPLPAGGHTPARMLAVPVPVDLDGDGRREIVIGADDGKVYAFRADGSPQPGWPVDLRGAGAAAAVVQIPAVLPLDIWGDGRPELIVGSTTTELIVAHLSALRPDGSGPVTGWPHPVFGAPFGFPMIGLGISSSAGAADLNGDGQAEIVVGGFAGYGEIVDRSGQSVGKLDHFYFDFERGGSVSEPLLSGWANGSPSFADLNGDGLPEIIAPMIGLGSVARALGEETDPQAPQPDLSFAVGAWNGDGHFLPGWPKRTGPYPFLQNPAVADLDGDHHPEVIIGDAGGWLHAFRTDQSAIGGEVARQQEAAGWPKFAGAWILASPAVADLDGDGRVEVVVTDREGRLFVWQTEGSPDDIQWAQFRGDAARSGVFHGIPKSPAETGEGCSVAAPIWGPLSGSSSLPILLLLVCCCTRWLWRRPRTE